MFLYSLLGPPQLSCPVWFLFPNQGLALPQTALSHASVSVLLECALYPSSPFSLCCFSAVWVLSPLPIVDLLYNVGSNLSFGAEALICLVQPLDKHFLQTAVLQSLLPLEPHPSAPSLPFSSLTALPRHDVCTLSFSLRLLSSFPWLLLFWKFLRHLHLEFFWFWFFSPPLSIFF